MKVKAHIPVPGIRLYEPAGRQMQLEKTGQNLAVPKYIQKTSKLKGSCHVPGHRANAMAGTIMRMTEQSFIQRKCAQCEEKKARQNPPVSFVQKKESADNTANGSVSATIRSTKGGGSPMPEPIKNFMESRFKADFSNVKIHSANYASQLSAELNARAFTVGNDIYFNEQKFSPATSEGKHLLAHELTHVVQQNFGREKGIQKDGKDATGPTPGSHGDDQPVFRIELPRPLTLRVNGIGVKSPLVYIQGANGNTIDIGPYTGNKSIDFPLAALEALGIPILSYLAFHGGALSAYRGMRFSNVRGLSGGTSFLRNALHYGYIQSDETDLFGAPGSFMPEEYAGIPNLYIHANPMDIGTMIDVRYFNDPLKDHPNNPAIMFTLSSSFDSNPLDALVNIGGAVGHMIQGDLYNLPGITHNYPAYDR